jgi:hypothetical protein
MARPIGFFVTCMEYTHTYAYMHIYAYIYTNIARDATMGREEKNTNI